MDTETHTLIAQFLRGELSNEAQLVFEKKLNNDADFKAQFLFEQQLFQSLNDTDWHFEHPNSPLVADYKKAFDSEAVLQLESVLKTENAKYQATQKPSNTKYIYSVAASLLLLVSVLLFNKHDTPQELYATYLNATELTSIITRGTHQDELSKAQVYFEHQDYKKALAILETEMQLAENTSGVMYTYVIVCQMQLQQFDKAALSIDTLIQSDLLDAEKGYWYKALLYLKQDDVAQSKAVLTHIVTQQLYNHTKAQALLDAL